MRIPKYQWLMPQPNTSCGFCDELVIAQDYTPKFQLVANNDGDNLTPSLDLETNPFNPITSDDLSFELVLPMSVGKYFTLYLGTEIIIFQSGSSTSFVNVGNLWVAQLPNLIKPAKIVEFLNNNIDPLIGTISSQTTGVILIENVPTGSYLDDNVYNTLTNINTIGAQEIPAINYL